MSQIKIRNTAKYILATLISLMLVSSFAASSLVTVQANPELPWSITLYATVTTNPHWGYYGGYHDIWAALKPEFAKIGINLVVNYFDDFTWWDQVWDEGWNHPGGTPYPPGGWDLTMFEWWLQPHAVEPWFSSMVYSWLQPPEGYNIAPWNNSKADELLRRGMTTYDAEDRQYYLWKWQEEFMHDPPWVNIYYPRVYEVLGAWVYGYEPSGCWWYDITHLSLDVNAMPDARKTLHTDWCYYAVSEDVWSLLPLFMETYTEEQMCVVQWNTLYRWSLKWENYQQGKEPAPTDYIVVPDVAAKDPYPVDGDYTRMRVELRDNVKWSDYKETGETVDAEDVVFSFNVCLLDSRAKSSGLGDFVWVIDHVEPVEGQPLMVDFILKAPCPDLKSVLANDWGSCIMPYHKLKQYEASPSGLKGDPSNWAFDDPTKWLPVTGPFKLKEIVPGSYVLLERNLDYFGYTLGWGPDETVQAIYLKWVPDAAVRLLEFKKYLLDFGEYPTAPIEVWKEMAQDPYLIVYQYWYPASNPIWFNFNNPILSNRYVRLAIAHAVNYEDIFQRILPSWGIEEATPGKTYIVPVHYYTDPSGVTVHLFNEELEPFHYDIDKALKYMYMWWYSTDPDWTKGPVGDADYSGLVDLTDFSLWRKNIGSFPAPVEVTPGNIIDPNFDNDPDVDLDDFWYWRENYGKEYPFAGAR